MTRRSATRSMRPVPDSNAIQLLLIEDNAADARLIQEILQEVHFASFSVVCVQRMQDAIAALDRDSFHLILLDLSLPDIRGLQSLTYLHNQKPDVPIVVLTSLDDEKTAVEALRTGAQDYLVKGSLDGALLARSIRYSIERHRALEALRESQERYALAARAANDGLWDWNLRTDEVYYSPRWCSMLGYSETQIGNSPDEWFDRVHPDDVDDLRLAIQAHLDGEIAHFEHEYRIRHCNGHYRWMLSRGLALRDENDRPHRIAGSQSDITVRKQTEQQLRHDALHDPLTALPNRILFQQRLEVALKQANEDGRAFAVLFLDLDRFKTINDSLGHLIGDKLLAAIAKRLEGCIGPSDLIARLGGDEFAVLVPGITSPTQAIQAAKRLLASMQTPFHVQGHDVFTNGSIGIAVYNEAYTRIEEILRDADIAMYRAKAMGTGQYRLFDADMHVRAMALWQLETDLRRAVERDEFRIHYQPIVSLKTGRLAGFEALVRWDHPERGLLYPADFLDMAEETGLLSTIDRWTIRQGAAQLRQWQEEYPHDPPLFLNVNISGPILNQPDLPEFIASVLEETGLPPQTLKLEITEGTVLSDIVSITQTLAALQALEVHLCIDDFGTGYSSLSSLHYYPINTLKIDSSFVINMNGDSGNADIVRTIITLAHDLDLDVIAEGVETPHQCFQLQSLNCEFAQGALFSHATDPSCSLALLTQNPRWTTAV